MIQVKNISKSFSGVEILKDISFEFEKGKTNLIIGKSGSGKSVLTKCIVGLFEPDIGEVYYNDRNFLKLKPKEKKEMKLLIFYEIIKTSILRMLENLIL